MHDEFERYLTHGGLPHASELENRYDASVLYFEEDREYLLLGNDVAAVEKVVAEQAGASKDEVMGISAYPGKVTGKARIVLDPFQVGVFDDGDILITGMTRPEFMPLIKKSEGIVTDVGGILCHAAITAREMKIPCVVGTAVVTKIFHDGDLVEVDADHGIVRKL